MTATTAQRKLKAIGYPQADIDRILRGAYRHARQRANEYIESVGNPLNHGKTADYAERAVFAPEYDRYIESHLDRASAEACARAAAAV